MKIKKIFMSLLFTFMMFAGFSYVVNAKDYSNSMTKSVSTQYGNTSIKATAVHHTTGNTRWNYSTTGGANTHTSHTATGISNSRLILNASAQLRVGNQTGYGYATFTFTFTGSSVNVQ